MGGRLLGEALITLNTVPVFISLLRYAWHCTPKNVQQFDSKFMGLPKKTLFVKIEVCDMFG